MGELQTLNHTVVEIPVDGEHQKQIITTINAIFAIQDHPLMEISDSPGHLLLLKLLQREEDLSGRRIAGKEKRLDSLKRENFQLCLFFFTFHGLFLTILFTSSNNNCQKWWIPMLTSLTFCVVMVCLVHMKIFQYQKEYGKIQRQKSEIRDLMRCVQELRMKGVSFDLWKKEPANARRMKSSSVEIKWRPIVWCSKYFISICLVLVSGLLIPLCKFMSCG